MSVDIVEHLIAQTIRAFRQLQLVSPWKVHWASVVKDLQLAIRYLLNLIGSIIALVIRLLSFLFFANIVTFQGQNIIGRHFTGSDMFIFFQEAILPPIFKGIALWTPLNAIQNDLYNGTPVYLFSDPVSRYAYYMGSIVSNTILSQIVFLLLCLILVLTSNTSLFNMLMVLVTCLTVLVVMDHPDRFRRCLYHPIPLPTGQIRTICEEKVIPLI